MLFCMDWSRISFDWSRARAFLATAEEGSLSAAARALGLAQPTLGRQVDALEEELGVALFERFGRGLQLTPAGEALLPYARQMGDAAAGLAMAAFGQSGEIAGNVTISASDATAAFVLPPILRTLSQSHPEISLTVLADNSSADLMRREADIAIRNFRPKEPDLVARKVRDAVGGYYAAPAYLDPLGPITRVSDLARARFISPGPVDQLISILGPQGLALSRENCPYQCNSFPAMWAMMREGLGIGIIDTQIGDAATDLVRVLPDEAPFRFEIWLVAHREVHRNARLRIVFDTLAAQL